MARTIAEVEKAHLLDEENHQVGMTSLEDAVFRDVSFFVLPRDLVLACDFDAPGSRTDALRLHSSLLLAGHRPVVLDSRAGEVDPGDDLRTHLLVRLPDRDTLARWSQTARQAGADVRHGGAGIRPPYALHKSCRGRSMPLYPSDPDAVLARLESRAEPVPLPERLRSLVYEEVLDQGKRSDAIFAFAIHCARRGWTKDEALLVLHDRELAIGLTYAAAVDARRHTGDSWFLKSVWPTAQKQARDRRRTVRQLRTLARQRRWEGRSGPTDRLVYLTLLRRAEACGLLEFGMSVRDLQKHTGKARRTILKSLRRLVRLRLIEELMPGEAKGFPALRERKDGRQYLPGTTVRRLLEPDDLNPETPEADDVVVAGTATSFRHGTGLGHTALAIYDVITTRAPEPVSMELITASVAVTTRTIRKHLRALVQYGYIIETVTGWLPTDQEPTDENFTAAVEAHEKMLVTHQLERELLTRAIEEDGIVPFPGRKVGE